MPKVTCIYVERLTGHIEQVHKVADVLESLEYQLTNEHRMH
jgi:hypothetical protein